MSAVVRTEMSEPGSFTSRIRPLMSVISTRRPGAQRTGDCGCGRVGVDVVAAAFAVAGHGCDDGNASLFEKRFDDGDVDPRDVPDKPEILGFGARGDEVRVKAAESHGPLRLRCREA